MVKALYVFTCGSISAKSPLPQQTDVQVWVDEIQLSRYRKELKPKKKRSLSETENMPKNQLHARALTHTDIN